MQRTLCSSSATLKTRGRRKDKPVLLCPEQVWHETTLYQKNQQRDSPCPFFLLNYPFLSYFRIQNILGAFGGDYMGCFLQLFYSLAFIDNFIPLEQRLMFFYFPINRHILTVTVENGHHSIIFFCLLTQLLLYKISYFRNAFQSRSGQNYISK